MASVGFQMAINKNVYDNPKCRKTHSKKSTIDKGCRVDEFVKELIRKFRKKLQDTFKSFYGTKKDYVVRKALEKMIRDFFTGAVWKEVDKTKFLDQNYTVLNIPEHIFDKHKDIFTVLIYTTDNLRNKVNIKNEGDVKIISDIFGNALNMSKLSKFLKIEAIQYLWWGNPKDEQKQESWTFYDSQTMLDLVKNNPLADIRLKL